MKPLVSVVTPVYNAEKYLLSQIKSILEQSYRNIELILIDDGSTDNSVSIIESIRDSRIRFYKNHKNYGIEKTTQKGIDIVKGKYIIFFDDDDIMPENRIDSQVRYLEKHADVGLLGGGYSIINKNGKCIEVFPGNSNSSGYYFGLLLFQTCFANGSAMVRTSVLQENGIRIRENSYGMQDFRLFVDISKVTKIKCLQMVTLNHRIHSFNATSLFVDKQANQRHELYKLIQKDSINRSGFELSELEISYINDSFPEGYDSIPAHYDVDFLRRLGNILKKLIIQSSDLDIADQNGFAMACEYKYRQICNKNGFYNMSLGYDYDEYRGLKDYSINKEKMKYNVLFFGAGLYLDNRIQADAFRNVNVLAILDNNKCVQGGTKYGISVVSPKNGLTLPYDYVIIMARNNDVIVNQLTGIGYKNEQIYSFADWYLKIKKDEKGLL